MVSSGKIRKITFILWTGILVPLAYSQNFPPLIWEDDDRQTISEPKTREVADWYDFLLGTLGEPTLRTFDMPRNFRKWFGGAKEAENVNAVDEVPNSSWFTNRNFFRLLALDEFARGPNTSEGPDPGDPWTVVSCKTQGVTPGFSIRDNRGQVYLLKFDPPQYPELTTAAEVIGSKIFHAAGYNVPENAIVYFLSEKLAIEEGLFCRDDLGRRTPLTRAMLDEIIEKIPRTRDGKLRAVASKLLAGKPKGPFSYAGWREDDANDVIAHEHRRELRGLRVIAAFINHNDIRQINTLDMYAEENGRKFLKHYFIDFGATLGSASVFPNKPYEGLEYFFDVREISKRMLSLGLYRGRRGESARVVYPALGYLETQYFDPENWKPNYPIASFENMTDRDAYWGAKIVASFTDVQLQAAVRAGRISDSEAEHLLVEALKRRRDRIANYWFRKVAPLDRFRVQGQELLFDDLALAAGYDEAKNVSYRVMINGAGNRLVRASDPILLPEAEPVRVKIHRKSGNWPERSVEVFIQQRESGTAVVGVRR